MPFIKKNKAESLGLEADTRKIFIGRTDEQRFFLEEILKAEYPAYNIISISGVGGVGKSVLLDRFIDVARGTSFIDYCLTAVVNERQSTPMGAMEKFADQLHLMGDFEKALKYYKVALRKLQTERNAVLHLRSDELANSIVESLPLVGGIAKNNQIPAEYIANEYLIRQFLKDTERLEDPISDLTKAFVDELNRLIEVQVMLSSNRMKRQRRVILFFDTFDQLAPQVAPWLLDYFLEANISANVVLVIAGRDPIERSLPDDPKRWLPYRDNNTIYSIRLDNFTEEETRTFLAERGITNLNQVTTTWQLSRGLPLYLGLLTTNPLAKIDPTADIVSSFLRWIPEKEEVKRKIALDASLLTRPFNQDELKAFKYIPEQEQPSIYRWLTKQPFVRSNFQDGRYIYHDLARELFSRHLYYLSPTEYYAIRRDLADYYFQLLTKSQLESSQKESYSPERLELALALIYQLFLLPDELSNIRAIEQVLKVYESIDQKGEIVRVLRELSQTSPSNQASSEVQHTANLLLNYVEADLTSQDFLIISREVLEKVAYAPNFEKRLLAGIYYRRAIAYSSFDEYRRALEESNRSLELDAKLTWAYILRGQIYFTLKEYQRAIQDFDHAIELAPATAESYANRGQIYFTLKEYQRAIQDFDRAIELNPNYTEIYVQRGETFGLIEEYERAIADLNRAIELDTNYAQAYFSRGENYLSLSKYQQALEDFERTLKLNPKTAKAFISRGRTYILLKEYRRAIEDFDRALKLNPDSAHAYAGRGEIYLTLGQYQRSIEDFDRAIALNSNLDWAYSERGLVHLWLKEIKQAIEDFNRNLEVDPTFIFAGWMIEWAEMCLGRNDIGRVERLQAIAAIDPHNYTAFICRGVALWLHEHFKEALSELEQAISLDPERWDAYLWKSLICANLGLDEVAVTTLEKSLNLHMPTILLAPLSRLKEKRPDFYKIHVKPLMS